MRGDMRGKTREREEDGEERGRGGDMAVGGGETHHSISISMEFAFDRPTQPVARPFTRMIVPVWAEAVQDERGHLIAHCTVKLQHFHNHSLQW
jgi:hypothetical protein